MISKSGIIIRFLNTSLTTEFFCIIILSSEAPKCHFLYVKQIQVNNFSTIILIIVSIYRRRGKEFMPDFSKVKKKSKTGTLRIVNPNNFLCTCVSFQTRINQKLLAKIKRTASHTSVYICQGNISYVLEATERYILCFNVVKLNLFTLNLRRITVVILDYNWLSSRQKAASQDFILKINKFRLILININS